MSSHAPLHVPAPQRLAAIDLGSNSFHMLVADHAAGQFQVVARLGEKVQLGAGLDTAGALTEATMQRALACLARFSRLLEDTRPSQLRVVGTSALRRASNSHALTERAEALLGQRIEIIAGREEARLIHLGVAHTLPDSHDRRLVVDIGGGSTELIIGEHVTPLALESLDMGCVAFTQRFFADGDITETHFHQAEVAALSELDRIRRPYQTLGWSEAIGSSGTLKAAAAVLTARGDAPAGVIDRRGLAALRKRLIKAGRLDGIDMEGLKQDRASVFPAGIAVLCAIFEAFGLMRMRYADGALREGVLLDMIGRDTR